jgi:hypothetical protein
MRPPLFAAFSSTAAVSTFVAEVIYQRVIRQVDIPIMLL